MCVAGWGVVCVCIWLGYDMWLNSGCVCVCVRARVCSWLVCDVWVNSVEKDQE